MVKHRRWSDKQKSDSIPEDEESGHNDFVEKQTSSLKNSKIKSLSVSSIKYVYIVVIAALLAGIFTPITAGVETESVFFGTLSIMLGLGGGLLIYRGITNHERTAIMVCGGLGFIFISLIIIYELSNDSILG